CPKSLTLSLIATHDSAADTRCRIYLRCCEGNVARGRQFRSGIGRQSAPRRACKHPQVAAAGEIDLREAAPIQYLTGRLIGSAGAEAYPIAHIDQIGYDREPRVRWRLRYAV